MVTTGDDTQVTDFKDYGLRVNHQRSQRGDWGDVPP